MALTLAPFETSIKKIVEALIEVIKGRSNATGTFTITPSVTTTVVIAPNSSLDSIVVITPLDALARAEAGPTTTYVSARDQGNFTVTHPSNTNVRTWGFISMGG